MPQRPSGHWAHPPGPASAQTPQSSTGSCETLGPATCTHALSDLGPGVVAYEPTSYCGAQQLFIMVRHSLGGASGARFARVLSWLRQ